MQRDKIKLIPDTPLVFTLEDPRGRPMTSQYHDGVEYRYNVTQNGVACLLYLPVDGSQALLRSGAKEGDQVELLKRMAGPRAIYTARVFSDAHLALPAEPAYAPPPPREIRVLAPAPAASQARTQPAYQNGATARQPEPQQQPGREVHPLEEMMQRCFVVGGRALYNAYAELTAQGVAYDKPTMEDLRAAGISLFIERTRK